MQLPFLLFKSKLWVLAAGFLLAGTVALIWYIPSLHQPVATWVRPILFGASSESAVVTPSTAPTTSIPDQLTQLEARLNRTEQVVASQTKEIETLQGQLKQSNTDIVQATAKLQQQESRLDQSIKSGAVSSSPGSTEIEKTVKVNLNTASEAELDTLTGIGPTYAQRIITYRNQNGPFKAIEDLMQVAGIKEGIFSKIRDMITV